MKWPVHCTGYGIADIEQHLGIQSMLGTTASLNCFGLLKKENY